MDNRGDMCYYPDDDWRGNVYPCGDYRSIHSVEMSGDHAFTTFKELATMAYPVLVKIDSAKFIPDGIRGLPDA